MGARRCPYAVADIAAQIDLCMERRCDGRQQEDEKEATHKRKAAKTEIRRLMGISE